MNEQRRYRSTTRWLLVMLPWLLVLLAGLLAVLPLIPPAPPSGRDLTEFSVAQALDTIDHIAQEPRVMGTPGNRRGREKIAAQLRALGLEPESQAFWVPNYFSPHGESVELVNVLARIPGTAPTTAIALVGHHDTEATTLGANDNTSAVAIMLDVARAILAGEPLRNDVVLIFTDGEEPAPRFGSTRFIDEHPWAQDVGFVINLEAIGSRGPSLLTQINGPSTWLVEQYARAVSYPAAFSFITALTDLIGGSTTDVVPFSEAGILGVEVAYFVGSQIYHTMADAPDNVGKRSVYQHGANTLSLARHLGDLDFNLDKQGSESVFFTIGRSVVRYPASWSLPVAILIGLLLLVSAWRHGRLLQTLHGFAGTLAYMILSMAAAAGIWMLVGSWRNAMGVVESYGYSAILIALTVVLGIVLAKVMRRHIGTGPDALGHLVIVWAFGLLTAIVAPGMSYLFIWPALAGSVGLLFIRKKATSYGWRIACWGLICVVTLVTLVPAIDFFYQFAQPRPGNTDSQLFAVVSLPIFLLTLMIELLRAFWPRVKLRTLE